jgi:hypothetical protein
MSQLVICFCSSNVLEALPEPSSTSTKSIGRKSQLIGGTGAGTYTVVGTVVAVVDCVVRTAKFSHRAPKKPILHVHEKKG